MIPRKQTHSGTDELFRSRLENIIDLRHELVLLGGRIEWALGFIYTRMETIGTSCYFAERPVLAISRHAATRNRCPLYPQQRTFRGPSWTSAFDPKETFGLDGHGRPPTVNFGENHDLEFLGQGLGGSVTRFEDRS